VNRLPAHAHTTTDPASSLFSSLFIIYSPFRVRCLEFLAIYSRTRCYTMSTHLPKSCLFSAASLNLLYGVLFLSYTLFWTVDQCFCCSLIDMLCCDRSILHSGSRLMCIVGNRESILCCVYILLCLQPKRKRARNCWARVRRDGGPSVPLNGK